MKASRGGGQHQSLLDVTPKLSGREQLRCKKLRREVARGLSWLSVHKLEWAKATETMGHPGVTRRLGTVFPL